MNPWHDIDPKRITPDRFFAVIEISSGSKNKYELDKETGLLKLDRILFTSTHYPANYGFIPLTYADDDDPLDVLVLCTEKIIPMTLVECVPILLLFVPMILFIVTIKTLKNCRIMYLKKSNIFSKFIKHWKEKTLLFLLLNQRNKLLKKLPIRLKDIIKNLKSKGD